MDLRRKLFLRKNPYDLRKTGDLFLKAVRNDVAFHAENCPEYAQILKSFDFSIDDIDSEEMLYKVPVIPTLYYKRNYLCSMPEKKLAVKATSSGTKGSQSRVGFDKKTLFYGILMMIRYLTFHKLISLLPTNYIVLGYEPSKHTQMGAIKTAYGITKFAPALHREYALKDTGTGYELNNEGIKKALIRYSKSRLPVRLVGFPSYMYFLIKTLKENQISLKLNSNSKVLLGGGWKQFSDEEIDRNLFFELIHYTLGIEKHNCFEFYSAVEHPLPYVKCKNGHFHVPIYSRAIIRDVKTLEPVPPGCVGLLSFVSPLVSSMPLTSVVTDDLAVVYDGESCGCGISTPYFELKGRAGVNQIKTCTSDASELARKGAK
ncbi:MAG: acyl-protein synthetase [Firmicutes bacterium HGW-Firmicutes-16]|nr:MAG: acyl-protein synthetase [Firmicutes bacterium HGW-Firmicutes-16]